MKLMDFLTPDRVLLDLKSKDKAGVLKEIADHAASMGIVPDAKRLYDGLLERENLISTGIGDGIAIPHTRYSGPDKIGILIARSLAGVDFDALDGDPVNLFIVIVGPESADKDQLKILSRTARLLKQNEFRERLLAMTSVEDMLRCIAEEEALF